MTQTTHYEAIVARELAGSRKYFSGVLDRAKAEGISAEELAPELGAMALAMGISKPGYASGYAVAALMQEIVVRHMREHKTFCYGAVLENRLLTDLIDAIGGEFERMGVPRAQVLADMSLAVVMQFQVAAYELSGKRTYDVSPGLAEQLSETELRGVMADDLRLPYEALYVVVPARAGLRVYNQMTGWHRCVGLYLAEDPDLNRSEGVKLHGKWGADGKPVRGWRVMAIGDDRGELTKGDDAVVYFNIPFPDGESLDSILEWVEGNFQAMTEDHREVTGIDKMAEEWRRIFKWAMNVALYVTHIEPGERWMMNTEAQRLWDRIQKLPKKSGKRQKLKARFQSLDPRYRMVIGKSITVKRGVTRGEGQSSKGRKLLHTKTRVAGHWRRVAHGAGRALRTWKWIAPYWKFKDGIELSKSHMVK